MGSLIIVIELARFWVTPLSPLYGGTVERVIKIVELFFYQFLQIVSKIYEVIRRLFLKRKFILSGTWNFELDNFKNI